MAQLDLQIGGVDFLPQYRTGTPTITERLQNKSNSMYLDVVRKSGESIPSQGAEIIFRDLDRTDTYLFAGFVTQVEAQELGKGDFFVYRLEATDYTYLLSNKIAATVYENRTLKYIVEDLISEYVGSAYNFDTTNVETGPTIETVTFDHENIRRCFEKLSKLTGYVWWVDYEKNIYFQQVQDESAPEAIRDTDASNHKSLQINYDTTQVRNQVTVIGSRDGQKGETPNIETFTGDGETRSWQLEDKPDTVQYISLNDTNRQFSLDVNERDTDYFIYNFESASFRLTDGQTTPTGSDEIEISYNPRIPIIVSKSDQDSINFFQAIESGDGIHDYTLKERDITSKAEALSRAEQELNDFADPLANGYFVTDSSMLQVSSIFSAGQILIVNSPSWNINTDTAFLIQEVRTELLEDGTDIIYEYTIRFGGKLVGVQEFLEALASEGEDVREAEEVITLRKLRDSLVVTDSNLTDLIQTPPFEYGTGGNPQGVWNLSEWS